MLTYEKNEGLGNLPAIADPSAGRQKLVWRQDEKLADQSREFLRVSQLYCKEVAYKPLENLEILKTDVVTEKEMWSVTALAFQSFERNKS